MNLAILEQLLTPAGQALLVELAGRELRDATLLAELERLRPRYDGQLARAAVELSLLRRRATAKFRRGGELYFTREALEQATTELVAEYRAARLYGIAAKQQTAHMFHVADLCCGIGGDALALAAAGALVTAVDNDPLRLALAAANAEVLGLIGQISFVHGDLLAQPPPAADAIFCDPARRSRGRRVFDVEQYQPPLSHILGWRAATPDLCVKLAPGVDYDGLPGIDGCELEFVSLDGELKEAVLWCGTFATATRRATLLPTMATLVTAADPGPVPQSPPGQYLYEPDPAVIRAHLVGELARNIGAAQIDPSIAYLTSDRVIDTPFARRWQVLEWLPFSLKRLRARVREYDAGAVTVKKRGSPLDTDALARQLSGKGSRPLVVVLTLVQGKPVALICTYDDP